MSRIGKLPVNLPAGVTVEVAAGNVVKVKGPLGQLSQKVDADITVAVEDNVAYDCISGIFVTQATLTVLRSKRLRFVKITPRRKVCLILRFRTVIWSFVCRLTMHRAAMSETQWSVSVCCLCVLPQCRSMRTVRSTSRLRACATKYRRIIRFSVKLYLCFQKGRKIKMSLNIEK